MRTSISGRLFVIACGASLLLPALTVLAQEAPVTVATPADESPAADQSPAPEAPAVVTTPAQAATDRPPATVEEAPATEEAPPADGSTPASEESPAQAAENPTPAGTPDAAPPAGTPESTPPAGSPEGAPPPAGGEKLADRFPNGTLRVERQVERDGQGKPISHGSWTAYYPDGKPIGGGTFLHGKMHGHWARTFRPGEGELFAGPLYGDYEPPFVSEANFVEGVLEGPWTIHDGKGQLISEWLFTAGKPDGPWTWFHGNGQKRREAAYAMGEPVGVAIDYDPQGKEIHREEFVASRRRIFRSAEYYPGRKMWEGWVLLPREILRTKYDWWWGNASTVVTGYEGHEERDGQWTWWYPEGQKKSEGHYVAGLQDGVWIWWHPDGKKWIEGAYVRGKQSGEWNWLTQEGKPERTKAFPVIEPPADLPPDSAPPAATAGQPASDGIPAAAGEPTPGNQPAVPGQPTPVVKP